MFHLSIGLYEIAEDAKVNKRVAVRAILREKDQVLMIKSRVGEYKFPGGGVDDGEALEDALIREIREETGYVDIKVLNLIGEAIERKKDAFKENEFFEMQSYYYSCELASNEQVMQELDQYEEDLEFKPVFVSMKEAKSSNQELLPKLSGVTKRWTERETLVLEKLLFDENR